MTDTRTIQPSIPAAGAQAPALLCEKCGYDLSASRTHRVCPECATPLSDSLPQRRTGTAWQRAWRENRWRLPLAYAKVSLAGLFFPWRQLRTAIISPAGARALLIVNTLLASVALTLRTRDPAAQLLAGVWPAGITTPALAFGNTWPLLCSLLVFLLWLGLFFALTAIERLGVGFYSRRRGWRVTPDISLLATSHASGAWLISAFLGLALPPILGASRDRLPAFIGVAIPGISFAAGSVGFIVGMLWFEFSTYFGVRACWYANPPESHPVNA